MRRRKLIKELGLETASVLYIECLIYHQLWLSDRCWKTPAQVRKGMKALKYKKDKESALKENIQICFKRFGWEVARTAWSKDRKKHSIPWLQARLIEIIQNTKNMRVPDKPPS